MSHGAAASTSDLILYSGPVMTEALGLLIPAWRVEGGDSQSGAHDASVLSEWGFIMQISTENANMLCSALLILEKELL